MTCWLNQETKFPQTVALKQLWVLFWQGFESTLAVLIPRRQKGFRNSDKMSISPLLLAWQQQ
jgi:hypothetical protein